MADVLPDLSLLTAGKAAEILDVDPKTFRSMQVPYVLAGKSRRYTRAMLQNWLERSMMQCQAKMISPPRRKVGGESDVLKGVKFPAKLTSASGRGRGIGTSASASKVIAFEKVAGLKIS